MAAATIPMVWADKHQGSTEHCAACGRKLHGKPRWVEVIDGGSSVAAPGLNPDTADSGYMGWFAVGTECARRHFKGFTHIWRCRMSVLKRYQVAFCREEDGEFDVVEEFHEHDDHAAIRYCEQEYSGEAWYLFDSEGRNVNGGVR